MTALVEKTTFLEIAPKNVPELQVFEDRVCLTKAPSRTFDLAVQKRFTFFGKITAIRSTFGQLIRIPFGDSSGGARQFQFGA